MLTVLTECRPTHTHVAVILPFPYWHQKHFRFDFYQYFPPRRLTILHNYLVTISRSTHLVISRLTLYNIVPLSRATSTILPLHRQASSTITSSITSGYEPKHFLL
jgi:hypothetical protein